MRMRVQDWLLTMVCETVLTFVVLLLVCQQLSFTVELPPWASWVPYLLLYFAASGIIAAACVAQHVLDSCLSYHKP